ncbi:hypothetical protein HDU76_000914 [Blyttiomyces sp. JEL0837]|nr:hypothetical protein HDU76_000914 [Blyttiomyces sp. JEL0837]
MSGEEQTEQTATNNNTSSSSSSTQQDVKSASAAFWTEFQSNIKDIQSAIDAINPTDPKRSILYTEVKKSLALLEKKVTDATIYLPGYDQRQCAVQLQQLNEKVSTLSKPTSKFSFGSRAGGLKSAATIAADNKQKEQEQLQQQQKVTNTEPSSEKSATAFIPPANATTFQNQSNTYITLSPSSTTTETESSSRDIYLLNLKSSLIDLTNSPNQRGRIGAIHVRNVSNCVIILGMVESSVMVDQCHGSVVVCGCRQFRMHNTTNTTIYLHVNSSPIIEDCTGIKVSPYSADMNLSTTTSFNDSVSSVGLDPGINKWNAIEDFNWLKSGKSPNWRVLEGRDDKEGWFRRVIYGEDGQESGVVQVGENVGRVLKVARVVE